MALRGVVAQKGRLIKPSTWGKAKAFTQYVAILLACVRFPDRLGPWYLDQWVMLIAVVVTVGSMWGYLSAFWGEIRSEPVQTKT
jgi:phosphatidylglycerophosphate synthase